MVNIQGLVFSFVFLIVGAVLLWNCISNSDSSQILLLSGAAFLAFGPVTIWLVARSWWKLRDASQHRPSGETE